MKKKNYIRPALQITELGVINSFMVSSSPSGTGEDMPWETSEEIYSIWKENF